MPFSALPINITFCVKKFISEAQPLHDFFIYLFIHESCFESIFIASSRASLNQSQDRDLKIVVFRSHLNNTIFNVTHKRFIREVFIIPIRHSICFLFFIEYFDYC